MATTLGCHEDEPLAFLVTTNRVYNVYAFTDVVSLFMYDAHCFLLGIKLVLLLKSSDPYSKLTHGPFY